MPAGYKGAPSSQIFQAAMFSNLGAFVQRALVLGALAGVVYSQTAQTAHAQTYDPFPFSFIGTIDDMKLAGDGPLVGGTLTVNGFVITVPNNTLVTLPSITVAWSELFVNKKPNLPLLGSVSWEATVWGNVVRGERIAGLVYIFQETTQVLQGFITSINYTTGHFIVDNSQECVLNDPLGRYGLPYTANPLWTVDADNPSVHSSTGFPLCIPRNTTDAECPLTNRPQDGSGFYLTSFTMPDPALVAPGGLDPRIMVPLVVGDYITYSGIKAEDGVLEIYSLEGNLGIYTAPGTKPAYITVEAAQYGIIDPNPVLETAETRATAIATDPSTTIQWFAIDVDPCTGTETERNLLLVKPDGTAPIGRTVFRLGKTDASPATREVGFRYSSGTSPGPRGIVAGQFVQPIFDFGFPELISFGANEVPLQFDLIPFLTMGSGPLEFGNYLADALPTPTTVGQLSPWPGNLVPGTRSCAPPSSTSASATSSASASSTPTVTPARDIITLLTATTRNQKGMTTTTVTASTNSRTAQLFLAITGVDNVSAQTMTNLGSGQFTLAISTKGKPSSVTVTSSENGNPVTQAV
ncbi:hypothetical protein B0H17DRAFT_198484 [Mycena rosella]|uniref:Uncharacterized protein n=1 Tax=Mycena rosella TaxID=1033263 RepID=A0AAD7CZD0_MYCRO|nr:hypothetical protein B0H17DRAFT_198484 [Mycena rosella]